VDTTPSNDTEFPSLVSASERIATTGEAAGRIDLLTVLMHELGHVLGRTDGPAVGTSVLMTATLPAATRRQPETNPLDVSRDGAVSPIDALLVINYLNSSGPGRLDDIAGTPPPLDVNLDGFVSPVDALMIINALNAPAALLGEGESVSLGTEPPIIARVYQATSSVAAEIVPRASMVVAGHAASDDPQIPRNQDKFLCQPAIATGMAAAPTGDDFAGSARDELFDALMLDDQLLDQLVDTTTGTRDRFHREIAADDWFRQFGQ
jgi:hypothetical protein